MGVVHALDNAEIKMTSAPVNNAHAFLNARFVFMAHQIPSGPICNSVENNR